MYLQILFYVAYFFCALFIIYLIILLSRINYRATLESVIDQHYTQKEAIENGLNAFSFENGKVIIYAKTQMRAMLKYKRTQLRKSVSIRRTLKKV